MTGFKLVLYAKPSYQMMLSCKCFPHVSEMPAFTYNRANSVIIKHTIILNIIHSIFNIHDAEVGINYKSMKYFSI